MDAKKRQKDHTTTQDIFDKLSQSKEDDIDRHNQLVVTTYRALIDFLQDLEKPQWPADQIFFDRVTEIFVEASSLVNSFTDLLLHYVQSALQSSEHSVVSAINAIRNTTLKMTFERYQFNNQAHHFQNPVAVSQDMHEVYRVLNRLNEQLHGLVIPPLPDLPEVTRRLNITCEILLNYMVLLKRVQQKIENYHFEYQRNKEQAQNEDKK